MFTHHDEMLAIALALSMWVRTQREYCFPTQELIFWIYVCALNLTFRKSSLIPEITCTTLTKDSDFEYNPCKIAGTC